MTVDGPDRSDGIEPGTVDDALIGRLATSPSLLVASDFDGVLAPIVDDPDRSAPIAASIEALARLQDAPDTAVAIVSGRERRQLLRLVPDPARFILVGSHGAEPDGPEWEGAGPDHQSAQRLARLVDELRALADELPGFFVEVKSLSVAAHFRRVDEAVRAVAIDAVGRLRQAWPATVVTGKEVVEFSVGTANKGDAIRALADQARATASVYLGDDVTDEDAFRVLGPDDAGIKIGPGPTAATHRLADPHDAADFLQRLADHRCDQRA
jgi:trehalose-phosphatase